MWDINKASIVGFGALAYLGGGSAIGETAFAPRITVSTEYDDNNRLTNDPAQEIEVTGAKLDAVMALESRSPTTEMRFAPRVRTTQYPGESDDSATDGFLDLRVTRKGERSGLSLDANYSNELTLGNFFPSFDLDPELGDLEPGTDTQAGDVNNRREFLRARGSVEWRLTERTALSIGAEQAQVSYDENDFFGRRDFSNFGSEIGLSYKVSETSSISVRGGLDRFDPDVGDEIDTTTFLVEYANNVDESYRFYVRAGANLVDSFNELGNSTTETGFSGGLGVARQAEVTRIFFDVNYYVDPNESGTLVNRTQARLGFERRLSELLSLRLGVRYFGDDGAPGDDTYVGRSYASADVGLNYRMTKSLSVFGLYEFRTTETDGLDSAQSNRISIGFTWEPRVR